MTTSWPKTKKDQNDKFAYIYQQFPEGWKIEALAAYNRKVNADQQKQLSQSPAAASSQLTSSGAGLPSNGILFYLINTVRIGSIWKTCTIPEISY